jgi:transposase
MSLPEEIKIENIDHLGIVAGLIDEVGIVDIINEKLGVDKREKITSGQTVKAMILNGLGMISRPLYLFSQFFEDKAVEKLLGKGVTSEYLNDDKIGRVMDEVYQLGLTELFVEIVLSVIKRFQIATESAHLDATSFHLHGKYQTEEIPEKNQEIIKERPIFITKGYSRDHRSDLKQCVLDLIVSNDGEIPLFMRTGDGNEADKAVFGKILLEFKKRIELNSIMVGDSALYTQENVQLMKNIKWITRVPLTIKKAKELIRSTTITPLKDLDDLEPERKELIKKLQEKGYSWQEQLVTYAGIEQRWLIVESEFRQKSDWLKLDLKIKKESEKVTKILKQLAKEEFETQNQARNKLKQINKKLQYFRLTEIDVIQRISKNKNNQSQEPKQVYQIESKSEALTEVIEAKRKEAGRFILATNIVDETEIKPEEILDKYKNQQSCERGFAFLKDPLFFADSFFVEKPERVETILWLMSLCLLVYNLGQRQLRNSLKRAKVGVKNQVGKLTKERSFI